MFNFGASKPGVKGGGTWGPAGSARGVCVSMFVYLDKCVCSCVWQSECVRVCGVCMCTRVCGLSYWGPLATSNLNQNLLHDVRFDTRFTKTWKHHFTSNDLTCDKTWIQICTKNDDVTRHKSRHGVSFATRYLQLKVPIITHSHTSPRTVRLIRKRLTNFAKSLTLCLTE